MTVRYDEILDPLRQAYDTRADWRDGITKDPWKLAERQAFLDRLPPRAQLLEIGAGTGQDSVYFQQEGCAVVAADLSPVMVEHCRAKGIEAHVMDFLHLSFAPIRRSSWRNESAEGPIDDDEHVPARFFSWRTDEQLLGFATAARFDLASTS